MDFNVLRTPSVVLLSILLCLWAVPPAAASENASAQDGTVYEIRSVSYEIEGRVRQEVLAHALEIETGRSFDSYGALEDFIADREQVLANQRTLEDGSIIVETEESRTDPQLVLADLTVRAEETWNLFLLPYGKYDSNEGLQLSLKGRDYNFLGGMRELAVDLDYTARELAEDTERSGYDFTLETIFDIPFYAYGLAWNVGFNGDVTYNTRDTLNVTAEGAPLQANSTLSLGLDVPLDGLTLKNELIQEYHLNEEGIDDPDEYFFRTTVRTGSSIPTGIELPLSDEITLSQFLFTGFSYKPGGSLSTDRRGYEAGFSSSLGAGRVDWKGNFRSGTKASLSGSLKWNFTRVRWLGGLSGEYQYHEQWGWGGLSGRAGFFYRYGSVDESAGDRIRGILDNRIQGDLGIYANLALPTKMWIWFLDRWFEGHLSPFFDCAVVRPEGGRFKPADAWYGAGLEAFAYAKQARSLYLRISAGVDLEAMLAGGSLGEPAPRDGGTPYELYIGLGHHY
jgi:hypothetical protein